MFAVAFMGESGRRSEMFEHGPLRKIADKWALKTHIVPKWGSLGTDLGGLLGPEPPTCLAIREFREN